MTLELPSYDIVDMGCMHSFLNVPVVLQLDRFIPSRSALDVDVSSYNLLKENASAAEIPLKVKPAHPAEPCVFES